MPKKAKGKSSKKDKTDAKSDNPSKQSDKPKPKKKQKSKEVNDEAPLSNHSHENGTKDTEEKTVKNEHDETDLKKTEDDEESQPDQSLEVPEENHDGVLLKNNSSTSAQEQPETSASAISGPKDFISESRPVAVVDVKSSQPTIIRDRTREIEAEEEQQSEEEKKAASDSPQSEGEEEGDEEESDQEIKQIEPQQIDFGTGKTPSTSQDDRFAFYTHLRKRISSFFTFNIQLPALPTLPKLPPLSELPALLPTFESISSIPSSIVHSIHSTFPSTEKFHSSIAKEVTSFRSKVDSTLAPIRSYATDHPLSVPPWLSQMFLALFYVHFLVWILISLLLISINVFTLLLGPWAVFPIGGWGIGLYLHLLGTSYILQASGAKTDELSWLESLISRTSLQVKGFTHTAYEVASHKYQNLCQSWCQGNRA